MDATTFGFTTGTLLLGGSFKGVGCHMSMADISLGNADPLLITHPLAEQGHKVRGFPQTPPILGTPLISLETFSKRFFLREKSRTIHWGGGSIKNILGAKLCESVFYFNQQNQFPYNMPH